MDKQSVISDSAEDKWIDEAIETIADQTLISDDTDAESAVFEHLTESDYKAIIRAVCIRLAGKADVEKCFDSIGYIVMAAMESAAEVATGQVTQ